MRTAILQPERRLAGVDMLLVVLYLIGIYTGWAIQVSDKIPFPAALAGISGMVLLWRRRNQITPRAVAGLIAIILLYLLSIFSAPDPTFLPKRFTGWIQIVYSLVIGYALYLTIRLSSRRQMAGVFGGFCLFILIGCLLEDYLPWFREISDTVRIHVYSYGIYDSDLRDLRDYGRVRPKLFTSEPSSVTYAFTLFCFAWLTTSRWRWKLPVYFLFMAAGIFLMPGPTLLLLIVLLAPFMLIQGQGAQGIAAGRLLKVGCAAAVLMAVFALTAMQAFPERFSEIASGNDASFFQRETGPAMVANYVVRTYPAGIGLTGEPFLGKEVVNIFAHSAVFSSQWVLSEKGALANYFWLQWIYLGLFWGVAAIAALSYWIRTLGVASPLYCWLVWSIFGQASGAYVGPTCWSVFFLAAAALTLRQQDSLPIRRAVPRRVLRPLIAT